MGAVAAISDAVWELVEQDEELEQVGSGFTFTEGPIWHPTEHYLLFSDMPGDVRRKYTPGSGVEEVMRPSNKGNGMTYDADLNLLVCEHVTSSVVREHPDGTRETIATHFEGKELNSPNDVIVAPDGAIYFSDPWYGRMPGFGEERERELGWQGVFRIPPGGGDLQLVVERDEFEMPNGLCYAPDRSLMYINDTPNALIKVYDYDASDGSLHNGRLFAEGIGSGVIEEGIPDGMKCDENGNIWVTGPGGVWIFGSDGGASAPSRCPRTSATSPGAARTGTPSSCRAARRCTRCAPRSVRTASPTWTDHHTEPLRRIQCQISN